MDAANVIVQTIVSGLFGVIFLVGIAVMLKLIKALDRHTEVLHGNYVRADRIQQTPVSPVVTNVGSAYDEHTARIPREQRGGGAHSG